MIEYAVCKSCQGAWLVLLRILDARHVPVAYYYHCHDCGHDTPQAESLAAAAEHVHWQPLTPKPHGH